MQLSNVLALFTVNFSDFATIVKPGLVKSLNTPCTKPGLIQGPEYSLNIKSDLLIMYLLIPRSSPSSMNVLCCQAKGTGSKLADTGRRLADTGRRLGDTGNRPGDTGAALSFLMVDSRGYTTFSDALDSTTYYKLVHSQLLKVQNITKLR